MKTIERRSFLAFLGKGIVTTTLLPPFITACSPISKQVQLDLLIKGIIPSSEDEIILAEGLNYELLIGYKDSISSKDTFGFNNDYTAFIPTGDDKGILWVNHEYHNSLFIGGPEQKDRLKENVDAEMYSLGGSILHIEKKEGTWSVIQGHHNLRITAHTMIPFNWPHPIAGTHQAMGTFQNCSGGVTPWKTILTCEENYQDAYGEMDRKTNALDPDYDTYGWNQFYDNSPLHYGWVVEVDPLTGNAQKHIALGRFSHESATIVELEDKRVVVYTGDDSEDEHLYKFISSKPGSLQKGTLYAANIDEGKWIPVDYNSQTLLQENFKDQTEVLIYAREAAKLLGATPLDRPEDIDIDPVSGHVLVTLTNNKPKDNYHGQIMKLIETEGKYDALTFGTEIFIAGGEETGFSCPDNMAFDRAGNLWFTSDISGSAMNKKPYMSFKNNGLFLVPRSGEQAGEVIQMASAPVDAEFTGPFFSPDGKTLFLSVQHPGERSTSLDRLTSHWPGGGDSIPKPSVVTIQGPLLEAINQVS